MQSHGDHRQRSAQGRLSRRSVLTGATLTAAGTAALLAGCSGKARPGAPAPQQQATGASPAAKQPKRGGVVNAPLHYAAYPGGWDTHQHPMTWSLVYRLFYEGLLEYDPRTLEIKPELAEKWEQPSPNELLFTLRQGVKFQNKAPANGRAMTVDDVIFSLNRVRTNEPRFANRSLLASVDQIQAVGTNQVRVTMTQPDAGLLFKFSADCMMVMVPELVQKVDKLTTPETAIGTGPFVMQSYTPSVGAQYVRNPTYWRQDLPYLDGVHFAQFGSGDDALAYAAFRAGQMHITNVPAPEVQAYTTSRGAGYKPELAPQITVDLIMYPNLKKPPFQDKRVTRALRLLVDYQQYRAVQKTAYADSRYSIGFPSAMSVWDLSNEDYGKYAFWKQPKDAALQEARSLLNAAGFSQSNPLKFETIGYVSAAYTPLHPFVQDQWKRNSQNIVDVTINPLEVGVAIQREVQGNFDYFHGGNGTPFIDPGVTFKTIYSTGGARNYIGFSDPKLDDMIDKSSLELDGAKRKALVQDALTYMIDAYPGQITGTYYYLKATDPKLRNYVPEISLSTGNLYKTLWLDA